MPTKFFIGGNKFYDSEEEANVELAEFAEQFGIPIEIFSVVKIRKEGKAEEVNSFTPKETVH